jgi:hypothetical protein
MNYLYYDKNELILLFLLNYYSKCFFIIFQFEFLNTLLNICIICHIHILFFMFQCSGAFTNVAETQVFVLHFKGIPLFPF